VAAARAAVAPERLRVAELVAEAEAAARDAQGLRTDAAEEQRSAEAARVAAEARERELMDEIERVRESAAAERRRAVARAEKELGESRSELERLRADIREARRLERQRGRATTPSAREKERERDRRLGAAAERAGRAQRSLARVNEPLEVTAPLAVGDPVVAAELGVRGTIAEITGSEATVLGSGGLRVRVPLDRLRPDRDAVRHETPPAVTVRAMVQNDVPDELDLRGRTAQEAREAVRELVDQAALAGRREVRVIHGHGTGAVRKAVRDELARHPFVEEHVSDSADGATVVRLGG
jgi:DNA mismatch repair protein MutS2